MIASQGLRYQYAGGPALAFADVDVPQGGTLVLRGDSLETHFLRHTNKTFEIRSRASAPPTFMPDGLYLTGVRYPEEFGLPSPPPLYGPRRQADV